MMLILNILKLVLFVLVLQPFLGMLLTSRIAPEKYSFVFAWCAGYFVICGTFYVPVMIGIAAGISMNMLTALFGAILAVLFVYSFVRNRKVMAECLRETGRYLKEITPLEVAAAAAVLVQAGALVFFLHLDEDDSFYIAQATTALETNTLYACNPWTGVAYINPFLEQTRYIFAPFPLLWAFLSKVTGFHPMVLAHTVMTAPLILTAYGIFRKIGLLLFRGKRKETAVFLLFLSLVMTCSYFSSYTQGTFLLVRIWQGKAQIAGIVIPAVLMIFLYLMTVKKKGELAFWPYLLCILLTSCLLSSMGMMLCALLAAVLGVTAAIIKKRPQIFLWTVSCLLPSAAVGLIYIYMKG